MKKIVHVFFTRPDSQKSKSKRVSLSLSLSLSVYKTYIYLPKKVVKNLFALLFGAVFIVNQSSYVIMKSIMAHAQWIKPVENWYNIIC